MKRILSLFIILLMLTPGISIFAQTIQELQQEHQEVRDQIQETQEELEVTQQEINDLEQEIREMDMAIEHAAFHLELTENILDSTLQELAQAETELEEAQQAWDEHFERFQIRLRRMYIQGPVGYLEVILQANSFSDFLTRLDHMNTVARSDRYMSERLQEAEDLVSYKFHQIQEQIIRVEELQSAQTVFLIDLEDAQDRHQQFMYELEQDAYRHEVALMQFQQSSDRLAHLIREAQAEEERRQQIARAAAQRVGQVTVQTEGGSMTWPLPGHRRLSSGYGYRNHPRSGRREFHTGIDLPAPRGTNIVAAQGGTVILSGWHGGFGTTVIIDHGNGLSTLYAHNSANLVSVGDRVSQGDVIARVGSTGVSTGPHLHFEVRRNGNHVNPGPYLGIR